jgi:hypothetical protein
LMKLGPVAFRNTLKLDLEEIAILNIVSVAS